MPVIFKPGSGSVAGAACRAGLLASVASLLVAAAAPAFAQQLPGDCGVLRLQGRYGPVDFRPSKYVPERTYGSYAALMNNVESHHYTRETELLRRKFNTPGTPVGADLAYTLHAFPNHHKALLTLVQLGEREKTTKPQGSPYSIECWFQRATAFVPDDNIVRMIFAQYLTSLDRKDEAVKHLRFASQQAADEPFTQHNIGLVYFDMKDYDNALVHAHKAWELGMTTQVLQEQLVKVGKWTDPPAAAKPSQ